MPDNTITHIDTDEEFSEHARRVHTHEEHYGKEAINVDFDYINSNEYRMKFHGLTESASVDDKIVQHCRKILKERTGTYNETLVLLNYETGNEILTIKNEHSKSHISYTENERDIIRNAKEEGEKIIAIHNHPEGYPPTADDCVSARIKGYDIGIVCGHNGALYFYKAHNNFLSERECAKIHDIIAYQCRNEQDINFHPNIWIDIMIEFGFNMRKVGT